MYLLKFVGPSIFRALKVYIIRATLIFAHKKTGQEYIRQILQVKHYFLLIVFDFNSYAWYFIWNSYRSENWTF